VTEQSAGATSGGSSATEGADSTGRPELVVETAPEKQTGTAREIRLELGADRERVDVRLSERAGEVKVAVRTPDSHLAERLRADLPALSSRLEEAGIRSETWRPPAASSAEPRDPQSTSTASNRGTQDEQLRQQGREQRHEGQPNRPRSGESEKSKEKGKDFEWFLSTTQ